MKVGKLLLYSLTGGSGLYAGHRIYQDGRLDINNFGIARFGRAALTVAKIGVDYKRTIFSSSAPASETSEYENLKTVVHKRSAERLLRLCQINGGCFIKVGQHIGALDYLLPEEYVSTMKVLHSNAPKMDLKDISAVLQEELGDDPINLFDDFEEEPLGTASLAQVKIIIM
jgi:aarF domain-containing kinase